MRANPSDRQGRWGELSAVPVEASDSRQPCSVVAKDKLFFEIAWIVKQNLDLEKVLEPLLECMARSLRLRRAEVRVMEEKRSVLESLFDGGDEEDALSGTHEGMADLRVWVGRTSKPAAMLCGLEEPCGIALLCVPILVGDSLCGTLCAERLIRTGEPVDEGLKPMETIATILSRAIRLRRSTYERAAALKHENNRLRERLAHHCRPAGMVGDSGPMQEVYGWIVRTAPTESAVLVHGERGTGKREVARALHQGSFRRSRAMIHVDCATLPGMVVGNEFGGDPAAGVSSAVLVLAGAFRMAEGGTLFLDHIDALPAALQVRLARVIERAEFEPGGGMEPFPCNVRIIGATHRALEERVDEGSFRLDLFQALNEASIRLPSLRERRGDILPLANHFVELFAARHRKSIERLSTAAAGLLLAYDWPGNVSEMSTYFEKAVLACGDGVIRANHFPPQLYASVDPQGSQAGILECAVAALEHDLVVEALTIHKGNIAAAARHLGTTERIMGCRVKKYGLDMSRIAAAPVEIPVG